MNGDDFDDIIIGAYGASPYSRFQAGTSYVIYGHSNTTNNYKDIDLASTNFTSSGIGFKVILITIHFIWSKCYMYIYFNFMKIILSFF